jgi:ribosomal protein L40E
MGEMFTAIIFFLVILAIATVAFWVWVVAVVARMLGRGVRTVFGGQPDPPAPEGSLCCPRDRCRALNPAAARFCRRCGRELLQAPAGRKWAAML